MYYVLDVYACFRCLSNMCNYGSQGKEGLKVFNAGEYLCVYRRRTLAYCYIDSCEINKTYPKQESRKNQDHKTKAPSLAPCVCPEVSGVTSSRTIKTKV